MDICLENNEKHICLAAVKIKMKGIAACLGFETRTTQRHLPPPPKASLPAIDTKSVCPRIAFHNPEACAPMKIHRR
jgi:hypothetical protein